jgi:glycosyltransferase involved in cell wall biosynthesis
MYIVPGLVSKAGTERIFTDKMNCLVERGHDIHCITYQQENNPLAFPLNPLVQRTNFDYCLLKLYRYNLLFRFIKRKDWLRKLIREINAYVDRVQPDIVIATMYLSVEVEIITRIKHVPIKIVEAHLPKERSGFMMHTSTTINKPLQFIKWLVDSLTLYRYIRKCDAVVALTEQDMRSWQSIIKSFAIPNLLNAYPSVLPEQKKQKTIIVVGRFNYQKGFDLLIQAWISVHRKYPDWHIHLYGEGEDEGLLRDYIRAYHLGTSFVIHPPTSDIMNKYMESDFYVMSSRFEGFGLVLIEAMACGIPCVSFDCPHGPSDIIKDGEDGVLVENGNVEQLAEKMCWMIEHEEERKEMGRKARENVKRYLPENIIPQWEHLFEKLVAEKKGKH